jgi:hypothetical protein
MTPQRLAVLRQPAFNGKPVEGEPQLVARGAAALLDVAARIVDERRQRRVVRRRDAACDAHQHDSQRALEGRGLRRFAAFGDRNGRLIQFRAGQRRSAVRATKPGQSQAKNRRRTQISSRKDTEVL